MKEYLRETLLLDYSNPLIQALLESRGWEDLDIMDRIGKAYDFVRDEILFGYNKGDNISASEVLAQGYGQCNTKGILLMALLRAIKIPCRSHGFTIPCRSHGFTIDKKLQKGAMTGIVYNNSPDEILHSWVEVYFENKWYELEGFILDSDYLKGLQSKFSDCTGDFCGYGVAVDNFQSPPIYWNGNHTYIQSQGIVRDLGVFDSPDDLLNEYTQKLSVVKNFLYRHLGRHLMNRNIRKIRQIYLQDRNKL